MEGFTKVAQRAEITPDEMKMVEVGDEQIVIAEVGGTLVAFTNICPHAECDLVYGEVDGEEIECDCHGSRFNLVTGDLLQGPATEDLSLYAVRVEGDDVLVGPA